jgi:hypothetical protein
MSRVLWFIPLAIIGGTIGGIAFGLIAASVSRTTIMIGAAVVGVALGELVAYVFLKAAIMASRRIQLPSRIGDPAYQAPTVRLIDDMSDHEAFWHEIQEW